MDFSGLAQPWQEQQAAKAVLPIRRNYSYFFAHNPKNWEFVYFDIEVKSGKTTKKISKGYWIPQLSSIHEIPGVNGCRDMGRGQTDSSVMRARMVDSGWSILHPQQHDYLRIYPARGGSYHSSRFEKLEDLAGTLVKDFQRDEFNLWRLELVKNKSLSLPHHTILKRLMLDLTEQINRKVRHQHIPEIKEQIDNLQRISKDMSAAIDDVKNKGIEAYD